MTAGFQLFECWDKGNLVGESPGNASLHEGGTPGSRNSIYCCNYHRLASAQRSCTHLINTERVNQLSCPYIFLELTLQLVSVRSWYRASDDASPVFAPLSQNIPFLFCQLLK